MNARHKTGIAWFALLTLGSGCLEDSPPSTQGVYKGIGVSVIDYLNPNVEDDQYFGDNTYVAVASSERDPNEFFMHWVFADMACIAKIEPLDDEDRFDIPRTVCSMSGDFLEVTLSYQGNVDIDENGGMTVTLGGDYQVRNPNIDETFSFAFDYDFDGERI